MKHPPRFVYLALTWNEQDSIIGDATNPWNRVASKRGQQQHGWKVELIIGPFLENASRFKREWQTEAASSTEIHRRILVGCIKARRERITVFASNPERIRTVLCRQPEV
jgi:hypothetical protein